MPHFSEEEKALLAPYVTSTDDDIFAVKNLSGIVGAVYARYSRAQGGFREVLLKEFVKQGVVDVVKAQDLVERVLIAYGDDSVGELEGAHMSFENISILATKEIEDRRIGGSPIEQSTRYVFYDQREVAADGQDIGFRYYRDPAVMASAHGQAYRDTMDFIFQTYCDLVEPMKAYYSGLKPMDEAEYDVNGDGIKEKYADCTDEKMQKAFRITYNADIRTKACDALRALLPIATKTNVGIFGNGRFFQNVLSHCYTSNIPEAIHIAHRAHAALDHVIPRYVKRARRNDYLVKIDADMRALATRLFADVAPRREPDDVDLIGRAVCVIAEACKDAPGDDAVLYRALMDEENYTTIAHMLFPYLQHSFTQIRIAVRDMSEADRAAIIATYLGDRKTRRDRPGRALEGGYPYTFDMVTDFGTYKDLERHRMMTQQRQKYTPMLGFDMPEDLVRAGFAAQAEACVARARALYALLEEEFPEQASYATLHGSLVRWMCGINDRSLMHLIELRTTPQGHPSYRRVTQKMHTAVAKRHPWRAEAMKFADHGDYFWSRGDAEAKQRVKEAALDAS